MALSVVHMHAQELPGNPAQWSPDFPRMATFASRDRPISSTTEIYPELTRRTMVEAHPPGFAEDVARSISASQIARPLA